MERWSGGAAPPWVGTDYGPPPDNPVGAAIGKFFGNPPRPPSEEHPDLLGGTPGSPDSCYGDDITALDTPVWNGGWDRN